MKIAIISPLIIGIDKDPETYSSQQINLAKYWAESGHTVDIITGRLQGLSKAIHFKGVKLYQKPIIWFGGKSGMPLMFGGLELFKNRYDLVFSSEHYQPTTFLACLLSPNVVIYQGQNTPGSTGVKKLVLKVLELLIVPLVRHRYKKVVAKTDQAADYLRKRRFQRISTIPCGYDSLKFRKPSLEEFEMSRKAFCLGMETKVLVYAGNLIARRNLEIAIETVSILNRYEDDIVLLIAGDGPERNKLISLAKQLNVESQIKFMGHLDWESLRSIYWAGDVFLFPTLYEIFGMVLLEALACGLKIVSTPCPAARDIIAQCPEGGKVVPFKDTKAFTEACRKILKEKTIKTKEKREIQMFLGQTDWRHIANRIIRSCKV